MVEASRVGDPAKFVKSVIYALHDYGQREMRRKANMTQWVMLAMVRFAMVRGTRTRTLVMQTKVRFTMVRGTRTRTLEYWYLQKKSVPFMAQGVLIFHAIKPAL